MRVFTDLLFSKSYLREKNSYCYIDNIDFSPFLKCLIPFKGWTIGYLFLLAQKYGQHLPLMFIFPLLLSKLITPTWRYVGPLLWLILLFMWQRLTHQGQWLGVIHHVANMPAVTDTDDALQGPWLPLLSHFCLSATPGLDSPRNCTVSSPKGHLVTMAQELAYVIATGDQGVQG